MPEYLAPGVFMEERSFRSKSIEGVSTTTTGFVGPTRYGPIEIEPEVITNVTEYERIYGKGEQLAFSDTGTMHNYMWHGVRAFFEEGGKRLYIARTFWPTASLGDQGYVAPPAQLKDDQAIPSNGHYVSDGHARCWLTPQTAAMSNVLRSVDTLGSALRNASGLMDGLSKAKDVSLPHQLGSLLDTDADENVMAAARALQAVLAAPCSVQLGIVEAEIAILQHAYTAQTMDATDVVSALSVASESVKKVAAYTAANECDALIATSDATSAAVGAANAALASVVAAAGDVLGDHLTNDVINDLVTAISEDCDSGGDAEAALTAAIADASDAVDKADAADVTNATSMDEARTAAQTLLSTVTAAVDVCAALVEQALQLKNQAYIDGITNNPSIDNEPFDHIEALINSVLQLAKLVDIARQKAERGVYLRAWLAEQADATMVSLLDAFDALALAGATTKVALGNHLPLASASERMGAILLRARFPGAAGNVSVRFALNIGQNGLVADAVKGLLPGDTVWIGEKSDPLNKSKGKLYLAYPKADGSDWYFSTDNTAASAKFWLMQPPSSGSTKLLPETHEVRIVTASVDVFWPNGNSQNWSGLALQPNHRRAGSADALTAKFTVAPASGTEARTLPFCMLLDDEVDLAGEVYSMIFSRDPTADTELGHWPLAVTHQLTGGDDGRRPGAAEYAGHGEGPEAPKTGLKAFEDVEDISIVAAPGAMFGYMNGYRSNAQQIVSSLISHAENMKYRIAVLESGEGQGMADVREMRARYDSKHAALYYPWVRVLDPVTRDEIHLPPSGFVAGIYARNDIDRAVYKAPANEVVRGAIGFQSLINKAQQEVLNPEGVNCFRFFEGRGFRLWGARTISSDPEWKYVNVRRYFAYLERSIDRGTQWAVFEPNGEALWGNVKETISDFLYNEWKNGALLGGDSKSAYFVRCDRSTMTQNDLDNGRLICQIGVAALKPAEFVIFQIGQWTSDRKA